jgi:hypothetical protein
MPLATCLARLAPHLELDAVALTGGVALQSHLPSSRAAVADVDFVARRMDAVAATVSRDFLVSHYHVQQPGLKKAIVQLVDPMTKLRIDIFPDLAGMMSRATRAEVGGLSLLVVTAADLLAYKLQMLAKPVDDKHWHDALALAALLSVPPPPRPPHLVRDVYCTDLALVCDRCERSRSSDFPLAPKRAIFDVLGYV